MGIVKTNLITRQINELLEGAIKVHLETGKEFEIVIPININGQELGTYKYNISNGNIKWEKTGKFAGIQHY